MSRLNITGTEQDKVALQRLALDIFNDPNASRLIRLIARNANNPDLKRILSKLKEIDNGSDK